MAGSYQETIENPVTRARYVEKLFLVGMKCPYSLPADIWQNDPRQWPFMVYEDIFDYLIRSTGMWTRQSRENYKSLRSKNLSKANWVLTVFHYKLLSGMTVYKADVTPSYQTSKEAHHAWAVVGKDGYVVTAHCTCKAGVGETCTHVGGMLYKIEMTCRMGLTGPAACTELACAWNTVAWAGVPPDELANIDFYSKEVKDARRAQQVRCVKKPHVPPSEEKKAVFIEMLKKTKEPPVLLSTFRASAGLFVPTKPLPVVSKVPRTMREVVSGDLPLTNKTADVELLEDRTKPQAACLLWHTHRSGRITSSIVFDILHTDYTAPSKTVMSRVCSLNPKDLSKVDSIKWGNDHEPIALAKYVKFMKTTHEDFEYKRSGIHLHKTEGMFASSPDGLVSCSCCGLGTVEAKCPYTLRFMLRSEWAGQPANSLENGFLMEGHAHELQCQHHMFVTGRTYCDYVVWTTKSMVCGRVPWRQDYQQDCIPPLRSFWNRHVYPTLRGGKYSLPEPDFSNSRHCYCGEEDNLKMVGCDSTSCKYEWFHYICVGYKPESKSAKWYCKFCKPAKSSKKRRQ